MHLCDKKIEGHLTTRCWTNFNWKVGPNWVFHSNAWLYTIIFSKKLNILSSASGMLVIPLRPKLCGIGRGSPECNIIKSSARKRNCGLEVKNIEISNSYFSDTKCRNRSVEVSWTILLDQLSNGIVTTSLSCYIWTEKLTLLETEVVINTCWRTRIGWLK